MSLHKLQSYNAEPFSLKYSNFTAILLTSSKGFSIQKHSDLIKPNFISFQNKAGGKFPERFSWAQHNLSKQLEYFGNIKLFVWLGTCDITQKSGKYCSLSHGSDSEFMSYVTYWVDKFIVLCQSLGVPLSFINIPPYSISIWNRVKGHSDPESFLIDDATVLRRISILNDYFTTVNSTLTGNYSPNFLVIVTSHRKRKNGFSKSKINYSLYTDGIHPSSILARCWMKKICMFMFA